MQFDALTMTAVRDELRATVAGGHVQKLVLPGDLAIGLGIYAHRRTHWLLLSAHPENARVQLAGERLIRAFEAATPLLLLLRKYVRNGRLLAIEQPPFERILRLTFSKILVSDEDIEDDEVAAESDELHGEPVIMHLIIEVMGRYSNIILVDSAGTVMEAVKRVPASINRFRTVLPHQPYVPPPALTKQNPLTLSTLALESILANTPSNALIWKTLVEHLRGISPLIAKEVAYRSMGDIAAPVAGIVDHIQQQQAILTALNEVLAGWHIPPVWHPSIARIEPEGRVAAYAAYELTQYPIHESVESISGAIDLFYNQIESIAAYEGIKKELAGTLAHMRKRVELKHDALLRSLEEAGTADRYRRAGELLLSYGYNLEPGATTLEAEGEQIKVDPSLSFSENAQHYFRLYNKAKNAVREVPALLEEAETQLAYLDQQAALLAVANNRVEIDAIRAELQEAGFGERAQQQPSKPKAKQKQQKQGKQPKRPTLPSPTFISADGLPVYIGRTAKQNDLLTFELAGPNDLWFHARNIPGAHVIVKTQGGPVPRRTLEQAAAAAAYYSQARQSSSVDVDYTEQRWVRRRKGAPPGLVNYINERTVHIHPQPIPARPAS